MIQYLLNSNYRQAHKFLSSLEFLEPYFRFRKNDTSRVRNLIREKQLANNAENFFVQCFKVFDELNSDPDLMAKPLIFIHLLLQTKTSKSSQMFDQMRTKINIVLENCKASYKSKMVKNSYSSCSFLKLGEQNCKQLNSMVNRNTNPSEGVAVSHKSSFSSFCSLDNVQSQPRKMSRNEESEERNYQISSPKQFISEKLIQPYAMYLLKKCIQQQNNNQDQKDILQGIKQSSGTQESSKIWKEINIMKLLLKITEPICTIGRYYKDQYLSTFISIIQVLHSDLRNLYDSISHKIKSILKNLQKYRIIQDKESKENINIKINSNNTINIKKQKQSGSHYRSNAQKQQLKYLLKQLEAINDGIVFTYWGKDIAQQLWALGLKMPQLLKIQNNQCQTFLNKIERQQRVKERKARCQKQLSLASRSKSKSHLMGNNRMTLRKKNLMSLQKCLDLNQTTQTPNRIPQPKLKNVFRKKSQQLDFNQQLQIPELTCEEI